MLQSVAVLAGVNPVALRPAGPVLDGGRDPEAAEGSSPLARTPDQLQLSPAALAGRPDDQVSGRDAGANGDADDAREDGSSPAPPRRRGSGSSSESAPGPTPGTGAASNEAAPAAETAELSEDERKRVAELQARDTEVRTHEQAHKAAGGQYAGAITYEYTEGPDGRRYATGGSVPIDASPVPGDPEATVAKMRIIRAAALAPAEPSPQDRKVAAQADRTAARAQQEVARERAAGPEDAGSPEGGVGGDGGEVAEIGKTVDGIAADRRAEGIGPAGAIDGAAAADRRAEDPADRPTNDVDASISPVEDPNPAPFGASTTPFAPAEPTGPAEPHDESLGREPAGADAADAADAATAAVAAIRREATGAYRAADFASPRSAAVAALLPRLDLVG